MKDKNIYSKNVNNATHGKIAQTWQKLKRNRRLLYKKWALKVGKSFGNWKYVHLRSQKRAEYYRR